jgi:hypothetical protein
LEYHPYFYLSHQQVNSGASASPACAQPQAGDEADRDTPPPRSVCALRPRRPGRSGAAGAMAALAVVAALLLYPDATTALDNGLALTPPMGWVRLQRPCRAPDGDLGSDGCVLAALVELLPRRYRRREDQGADRRDAGEAAGGGQAADVAARPGIQPRAQQQVSRHVCCGGGSALMWRPCGAGRGRRRMAGVRQLPRDAFQYQCLPRRRGAAHRQQNQVRCCCCCCWACLLSAPRIV